MNCPLLAVFIIFIIFCHQVVYFIHLVFRQPRELNLCPLTMAQTVSPWRSPLDQGASLRPMMFGLEIVNLGNIFGGWLCSKGHSNNTWHARWGGGGSTNCHTDFLNTVSDGFLKEKFCLKASFKKHFLYILFHSWKHDRLKNDNLWKEKCHTGRDGGSEKCQKVSRIIWMAPNQNWLKIKLLLQEKAY